MDKPARNSSLEAFRLFCMVGIVLGHTINLQNQYVISSLNKTVILFLQGFTTLGVTAFMLISGYFSINFNVVKAIKLHHTVIFYAVLSTVAFMFFGNWKPTRLDILGAVLPILFYRYWFISCYFVIMLLSPFINRIAESLSRRSFEVLLGTLLGVYVLVPTIFINGMLNDGGKGIVNIFISYLLGQYLRKYVNHTFAGHRLISAFVVLYLITFGANLIVNTLWGGQTFFKPYGRDNSVTIIGMAVVALLWVRQQHFTSSLINRIASGVLSVYLFEEVMRGAVRKITNPDAYVQHPAYGLIAIVYTLIVVAICLGFDQLRLLVAGPVFNWLADAEAPLLIKLYKRALNWLHKADKQG